MQVHRAEEYLGTSSCPDLLGRTTMMKRMGGMEQDVNLVCLKLVVVKILASFHLLELPRHEHHGHRIIAASARELHNNNNNNNNNMHLPFFTMSRLGGEIM
jgi:hypothetical protein